MLYSNLDPKHLRNMIRCGKSVVLIARLDNTCGLRNKLNEKSDGPISNERCARNRILRGHARDYRRINRYTYLGHCVCGLARYHEGRDITPIDDRVCTAEGPWVTIENIYEKNVEKPHTHTYTYTTATFRVI